VIRHRAALLLLLALPAAACRRAESPAQSPPPQLPTVDVGRPVDAHATTAGDAVEVRHEAPGGISGQLPGGFPRELPLPGPAGVVDFGPGEAGPWIELVAPRAAAAVEAAYRRELAAAGFTAGPQGRFARGTLAVRVTVAPRGAGASVRIETLSR
jgi:hypothetical protein